MVQVTEYSVPTSVSPFVAGVPVWPVGRATRINDFVVFTADFEAKSTAQYLLRLTGSTLYRVRLNGEFVSYGPARGPKGIFRVDEVALPVKAGQNHLEIEVQGSNACSYYCQSQPSFLQAEVCQEGRAIVWTGESFRAFDGNMERLQKVPRFSFQRMFCEVYRVSPERKALPELPLETRPAVRYLPRRVPQPEYKIDSSYRPIATIRRRYDAALQPQMAFYQKNGFREGYVCFEPEEMDFNSNVEVMKYVRDEHGPIVSTMYEGRLNNSGFIKTKVRCTAPGRLFVMFDEIATPETGIDPLRVHCINVVVWEMTAAGTYDLEAFESNSFKYAEIFFDGGVAEILEFGLREYKNPLAWNYDFKTDDPVLAKIFEAGRETYAANAVDVFMDCPTRERSGWLCDSYFTAQTSLLLTGSTLMERVFLENFAFADEYEFIAKGAFPMIYPGDCTDGHFIPNWAMWLVIQLEQYLERSGDRALIEVFKPRVIGLVKYLDGFLNADGLLEKLPSWVFIEWSKANDFVQDVNYPSNMTYAAVLDVVARLYDMPELAQRAAVMRDTIRRQSWNGKWFRDHGVRQADGTLLISDEDITETCQYYAFYFGTATKEMHPDLWNTLLNDFGPDRKEKGLWKEIWPSNAFIGNYLRLDLLARSGLLSQVLKESKGYFLKMAELTGTLWEHDSTVASCCHGFASYINVLLARG